LGGYEDIKIMGVGQEKRGRSEEEEEEMEETKKCP